MVNRKIGLDYVRAVAILFVLVCHTFTFFVNPDSTLAVPFGAAGVEIFFVLSGYLIGGIFLSEIHKNAGIISPQLVTKFWARRWLRTLPNYFLFLLIFAIIYHQLFSRQVLLYLPFLQNLAWPMNTDFFAVSWSLAVEEWFYLLMPLLALALFTLTRRYRSAMFITTAILFLCPIILRLTLGLHRSWDDAIRKVVIYRLDAIMWGVILAALQRYRPRLFKTLQKPPTFLAGFILLIASGIWIYQQTKLAGDFPNTPLTAFIFTSFNLSTFLMLPFCSTIPTPPTALNHAAYFISVWSYSMYLCHVVVFKATDRAFHSLHLPTSALRPLVAWPAVFALSAFVYYAFELPILQLRDRLTHQPSPATTPPQSALS